MEKSVLVLGDSHALIFNSEKMKELFIDVTFNTVSVGGATVSGLENPNAVSQAMPQDLRALKDFECKTVVVMLGEVDTGFVIWYRAQKHQVAVEEMYQQAVLNYQRFMLDIAKDRNVICISTPLPTIRDGIDWGDVANLRKEVKATLRERTQLTIRFNKDIEYFCERNQIIHCNLDSESLDEEGQLKESLRNPDSSDHHYDPAAHSSLLAEKLRPAMERYGLLPRTEEHQGLNGLARRLASRSARFLSRLFD